MENNYEALRIRINELLPDRKKLEFGCEAIFKPDGEVVTYTHFNPHDGHDWALVKAPEGMIYIAPVRKQDLEILGKPLTIEDVLRALRVVKPSYATLAWLEPTGFLKVKDKYEDELWRGVETFDLTKPLSAPENDAACGAVLKLLT